MKLKEFFLVWTPPIGLLTNPKGVQPGIPGGSGHEFLTERDALDVAKKTAERKDMVGRPVYVLRTEQAALVGPAPVELKRLEPTPTV